MRFRETTGDDVAVRPDVLPARRAEVAGARVDLRARRRRRGADDHAVHAAELDRGRRQPRAPSGRQTLPMLGDVSRTALITGVVVAVLTWAVIIGGIKSIGRAAEKLAPLKVGLYLLGGSSSS